MADMTIEKIREAADMAAKWPGATALNFGELPFKALDDRYVELMKIEQRRFFRESDGINLGTSDKPVCVNRVNAGQLAELVQRLYLEHVQP